jgi:hypothetical protein
VQDSEEAAVEKHKVSTKNTDGTKVEKEEPCWR